MSSEWYSQISRRLGELKHKLLPRDVKEYQIDKLLSISRRVDEFSAVDPACREYRQEIDAMVTELYSAPLSQARNKYQMWKIGELISHLKKKHGLVNEGEYLGWSLVIGLIAGGVVGFIIGNTPPATGAGLALGAVVGLILDARAKKTGRVI
jgi:hypothetical protein